MSPAEIGLYLFISFGILLAVGMPISVCIGISSIIAAGLSIGRMDRVMQFSAQRMFSGMDSFSLLAIPFFVLAGNLMNHGGIALRLINLAKAFAGRLPGSLLHANIIANMLFGAISGSGVAAAAAVGGTLGPIQKKEGLPVPFCAATNIASAPTGFMIPPSNTMIVFSLVSGGTSIAALFIGGYLPGILMGVSMMAVVCYVAKKNNFPVYPSLSWGGLFRVIWDAVFSLLLIVIVIGGIVGGFFTATEGAAVAVVYAFCLSLLYRSITMADVWKSLKATAITTAVVMFLIGSSSIMSWVMSYTGVPKAVSAVIMGFSQNKYVILLLINVCLAVVGMFMDATPAILIFTPIFMPIVLELGMHPVHFGLMMVYNMCMGSITPPVGTTLFVGCSIAGLKLDEVIRPLLPFFVSMFIGLLIMTYVPWFTLALPRLFGVL